MSTATDRMNDFASRNRLKLGDTGAEKVVFGKFGELADMNDVGELRMRLLAVPRYADVDNTLRNRKRQALAAGLKLKWAGHAESIFYFDPENAEHVDLVVKLIGAKRRRKISPEQANAMSERLAASRSQRIASTTRVNTGDLSPIIPPQAVSPNRAEIRA